MTTLHEAVESGKNDLLAVALAAIDTPISKVMEDELDIDDGNWEVDVVRSQQPVTGSFSTTGNADDWQKFKVVGTLDQGYKLVVEGTQEEFPISFEEGWSLEEIISLLDRISDLS